MRVSRRALGLVAGLLVVALVVAVGLRQLQARKAQQAAAASTAVDTALELIAGDLVEARERLLVQGLPVSGAIKAVQAVVLRARVAGELQDLRVREGDSVQAGQVIARIDPEEVQARLRQAQEQADAARTQIDIAQRQYTNNQALVDQGFISRTALESSESSLRAAQATHRAALAAVALARKSLDDAVLRAPIAGQIAQRLAQPGERVAVDTRIVEIVDLRQLELEAVLAAADAQAVRVGQSATLHIEGSLPGAALQARVARINPSAQAGSRGVLVYLALDPAPGLRQGLFVQGLLDTGQQAQLSVPLSAVRTDQPAPYVQLIEHERVVHRPVQPGLRGQAEGDTMVAVPGIAAGSLVLRGSVGRLAAGTAVRLPVPRP
ncbi:efflux RND transporter periplasmic adaptor subunit [Pseudorhodoferax sp. Leaf267]|uniref:efflux RND transporter periplasmic adaptor subunit n=1 Tax=Pseudorhodoferax sp. Leaf267 TaxID=1736316 RepID=UPI0006F3AD22|nr:efflux RND transporter periplasmic adaptor subunit [Pseudorhodoferax sp. Leaf267]KQP19782.1 secretion protein HlyD [Pseudorhodoferax sp. Leaf267]